MMHSRLTSGEPQKKHPSTGRVFLCHRNTVEQDQPLLGLDVENFDVLNLA